MKEPATPTIDSPPVAATRATRHRRHSIPSQPTVQTTSSGPCPACLGGTLAALGAAAALAAIVWTTYAAFDHAGFDLHAAVVVPVMSALGQTEAVPVGASQAMASSASSVLPAR